MKQCIEIKTPREQFFPVPAVFCKLKNEWDFWDLKKHHTPQNYPQCGKCRISISELELIR